MMPKGWNYSRLDSVCSKITDGAHHSPKSVDNGYPMYSVKDMSYLGFYQNTARLIDESDYLSLANQNCKPLINDILIAKDGSILKHCFVVKEDIEGVILSSIALLRPKLEKIYPEYIAQYFSQEWVKSFVVRALTSGSGVPRIILKDFKSIKIPLPPLPEQQKIAKILSTWDKAISTTERLIDNSTQQKKALMQQLLTGKKRLLGFEEEWISEPLEKVVGKIYGGGTPSKNVPGYWDGDIPWVTVKDLIATKIDGAQQHINKFGIENSSANIVPAGTVIIATRMALGKAVIASCDVAINQDLKAITGSSKINSVFLHYWLLLQAQVIERLGTGSTVKGVQLETIKSLRMHIPSSIEEQQKIAAILTTADNEIELLEQQLADLQQEKKALMQVLLTGKKRVVVD